MRRFDSNIENGLLTVENYRQFQYTNIPNFFQICIDYFNKHFDKPVIKLSSIETRNLPRYYINTSFLIEYNCLVEIISQNKEESFFKIIIPELVYDHCYILNGAIYVPSLYILDKPIVIKKESIKLDSLFNPISIFFKKNIVTIMQHNISLQNMIDLFCKDESHYTDISEICLYKGESNEVNLIEKFKSIFNRSFKCREDVWKEFDRVFFDSYTRYVYYKCYNVTNFYETFNLAVKKYLESLSKSKSDENLDFINLKNKRIVFIELLLEPLFKYVSRLVNNNKRHDPNYLNFGIDPGSILKNFRIKLHLMHLHTASNLMSGITSHATEMVHPSIDNPPSSIALLHETHFGKICPITISEQEPGRKVSVIYGTQLDEIGQFIFD